MTTKRLLFIAATILFGVVFLYSIVNGGFQPKDLGWLGFTLMAAGLAA